MILALETATNVCSVALQDDEGTVHEKRIEQHGSHSEQLFLFAEEMKKQYDFSFPDLDAVLVSEGPGSYTGLRIGASAVKGLLFQTDVPLYAINTLASFAVQAIQENPNAETIHSIIDARRAHVYHQKFTAETGKLQTDDEVEVIPIKALESMVRKGDVIIGTGLKRINEDILSKAETYGPQFITAKSLIRLYRDGVSVFLKRVEPESFDPKYYTSNQVNNTQK